MRRDIFFVADGHDLIRRSFELGRQAGVHRRNRELIAWTKKRRRRIAREDLIGYVCGCKTAPPSRHRTSGPQFTKTPVKSASSTSTSGRLAVSADGVAEPDLQLFQDALALHGNYIFVIRFIIVFSVMSNCTFLKKNVFKLLSQLLM